MLLLNKFTRGVREKLGCLGQMMRMMDITIMILVLTTNLMVIVMTIIMGIENGMCKKHNHGSRLWVARMCLRLVNWDHFFFNIFFG